MLPLLPVLTVVPRFALSEDRQVPVSNISDGSPLSWLCHLNIHRRWWRRKFSATGSAVAFRDRYLLTAGHNIYQDKSTVREIEVRVGPTNARQQAIHETTRGRQGRDSSRYVGGLFGRMPFAHDYGVVRLSEPFAEPSRFVLGEPPRRDEAVFFAGYPGGRHDGWTLHEATAKLGETRGSLVGYDLKTYKSNSGGPVWRMADGVPELVAIHVAPSVGRAVDNEFVGEVERLIARLDAEAAGDQP